MDDTYSAYSSGMTTTSAGADTPKRRFIRTLCRVPATVKPLDADISLSCTITDISPAGCYMEMLAPLPVETCVEVIIASGQSNLQCMGVVRHSLGGMGMGVRFDNFTPAQLKMLREIVPDLADIPASALSPAPPAEPAPAVAPKLAAPPARHPASAGELFEATIRLLLRKGIITRAELAEELEKGKHGKH